MVTTDPLEAQTVAATGGRSVLVVPESLSATVVAQPGRLALLIGDPDDPAVMTAAAAMEAELYARPPVGPAQTPTVT